jgi:hypothetical protein
VLELKVYGHCKRVQFCHWLTDFLSANGEHILVITCFSDEAEFRLCGYISRHNGHMYLAFNPREFMETSLHEGKVDIPSAIYDVG